MSAGYQSSAPGPYKTAVLDEAYRAVKVQSSAGANVVMTVDSAGIEGITLTLAPGETHPGTTTIRSVDTGSISDVIGWII